jgi:ribosomal protein L25 (general stress protein Ctc)
LNDHDRICHRSHRTANGKGAARRLRAAEQVPAIVYSKGKTAESVSVEPTVLSLRMPRGEKPAEEAAPAAPAGKKK